MAPEVRDLQKGKSYDPKKADVYSLGVCLFVLLFKQFPSLEKKQVGGGATYEMSETD